MCMAKTPRPVASTTATDKPLQVLRNPYLDGIDPIVKARKAGTGSFRIDRGSGKAPVTGLQPPPVGPRSPATISRMTPGVAAPTSSRTPSQDAAASKAMSAFLPGGASISRYLTSKAAT